jgi:nitroreductase
LEHRELSDTSGGGTTHADVLTHLMERRFSCRGFEPRSVPRATIERMLTMAQRSPSWCNSQPWQVIVTEGAGTERFRKGLYEYAEKTTKGGTVAMQESDFPFPERYVGVYKERRRECAWQLYQSVGVAVGDRTGSARQTMENFNLFNAPHAMIITTARDLGIYGVLDCGVYLGFLLLAAQSLGIATIPQAALAGCAPFIRAHFGIPGDRAILVGMSFGYVDEKHAANRFRTCRAGLEVVARWSSA